MSQAEPNPDNARAVVFDFDGVLVDSEPLHQWAFNEVIAPRGWEVNEREFDSLMVGKGDEACFAMLGAWYDAPLTRVEIGALCNAKTQAMTRGIEAGRFEVQPGARELITGLSADVPLAVCSGSRRAVVEGMLRVGDLRGHFREVVTFDDVSANKPDPEGYRLACERLGFEPSDCVAIEDSDTGVAAAAGAGMRVVAVEHSMAASRLRDAGAHQVAPSIAQLDAATLLGAAVISRPHPGGAASRG